MDATIDEIISGKKKRGFLDSNSNLANAGQPQSTGVEGNPQSNYYGGDALYGPLAFDGRPLPEEYRAARNEWVELMNPKNILSIQERMKKNPADNGGWFDKVEKSPFWSGNIPGEPESAWQERRRIVIGMMNRLRGGTYEGAPQFIQNDTQNADKSSAPQPVRGFMGGNI